MQPEDPVQADSVEAMAKLGHAFWPVLGRPSGRACALNARARAYVLARCPSKKCKGLRPGT
eukprot:5852529-Lingulodinium_polyedra.AAC.1